MRNVIVLGFAALALAACSAQQQAQIAQACHLATVGEAADPNLVNPSGKVGGQIIAGQTVLCAMNSAYVPPAPTPTTVPTP